MVLGWDPKYPLVTADAICQGSPCEKMWHGVVDISGRCSLTEGSGWHQAPEAAGSYSPLVVMLVISLMTQ